MDLTYHTLVLAFGLGLLGFIEPCTVGAHLIFLNRQLQRPPGPRLTAAGTFILARIVVMAGFGSAIAMLGQQLINVQTGFWSVFGMLYLVLGLFMLTGLDRFLKKRIVLAPERWQISGNPLLQGLAFGFNIPACAAPILFALMGTAALTSSTLSGAMLMSSFALALSLPLLPLTLWPRLAMLLARLADWLKMRRWLLGVIFVLLGIWSVWFGLFVNPADWSGT